MGCYSVIELIASGATDWMRSLAFRSEHGSFLLSEFGELGLLFVQLDVVEMEAALAVTLRDHVIVAQLYCLVYEVDLSPMLRLKEIGLPLSYNGRLLSRLLLMSTLYFLGSEIRGLRLFQILVRLNCILSLDGF